VLLVNPSDWLMDLKLKFGFCANKDGLIVIAIKSEIIMTFRLWCFGGIFNIYLS
jgi:hypothetical protein